MPKLARPKQERYAQAYVQTGLQGPSYAKAGYKPHDGNAWRMSRNEQVQDRIEEILDSGSHKALTPEFVLSGLVDIASGAEISPGARVKAYELLGKTELGGRQFKDQIETTEGPAPIAAQLDAMATGDMEGLVAILVAKLEERAQSEAKGPVPARERTQTSPEA